MKVFRNGSPDTLMVLSEPVALLLDNSSHLAYVRSVSPEGFTLIDNLHQVYLPAQDLSHRWNGWYLCFSLIASERSLFRREVFFFPLIILMAALFMAAAKKKSL